MNNCTGIVLAGGKSRRYGRAKAFEQHEGRYFYQIARDALLPWTTHVVIQTSRDLKSFFGPEHVYTDISEYEGEGPLAGLYTAMDREESEWFIVLPCDVPFITQTVIKEMIRWKQEQAIRSPLALKESGREHPLFSIWEKREEPALKQLLEEGHRSVRHVFRKLDGVYVDIRNLEGVTDKHVWNVNTEEEYKKGSLL